MHWIDKHKNPLHQSSLIGNHENSAIVSVVVRVQCGVKLQKTRWQGIPILKYLPHFLLLSWSRLMNPPDWPPSDQRTWNRSKWFEGFKKCRFFWHKNSEASVEPMWSGTSPIVPQPIQKISWEKNYVGMIPQVPLPSADSATFTFATAK